MSLPLVKPHSIHHMNHKVSCECQQQKETLTYESVELESLYRLKDQQLLKLGSAETISNMRECRDQTCRPNTNKTNVSSAGNVATWQTCVPIVQPKKES